MSNSNVSEDRVRDEAYRLWEQAGRPHGRDAEFWHQARDTIGADTDAGVGHESPTPAKLAAPAPKPRKKAPEPTIPEPPRRRPRKAGAQPNTPSA